TLAAEFVVLFVQLWALRKEVRVFFEGIQYISIIAALAVSCVVSYIVFRDSSMNAFLQLFFSALVFFGIYLSLLCVLREKLTSELLSGLIGYVKRKRRK
ncbi:MAG: polysaccharide biosynthesis C-terminal domain-containing protein, partial [Lachnospiraceae bacterium]|nr:polysaccharide biosynthesis C-terminal domain-containing protein [Lachnospiraceae bacterium]